MPINFEAYISDLTASDRLEEVNQLLNNAQTGITFLGTRIVENSAFEGSITLDELARKINIAAFNHLGSGDLTPRQRISGADICNNLKRFYELTDIQIDRSNCITKLIAWIREIPLFVPTMIRFDFRESDSTKHMFLTYTPDQFYTQFGNRTVSLISHPAVYDWLRSSSSPSRDRIIAREQSLRTIASLT
ncbi:MAG: hypothetical protein JSR39_08395 [Verrucomicrobia bacterium]|nr:hypothetical protein [Verrucomicrobiota bacterium]